MGMEEIKVLRPKSMKVLPLVGSIRGEPEKGLMRTGGVEIHVETKEGDKYMIPVPTAQTKLMQGLFKICLKGADEKVDEEYMKFMVNVGMMLHSFDVDDDLHTGSPDKLEEVLRASDISERTVDVALKHADVICQYPEKEELDKQIEKLREKFKDGHDESSGTTLEDLGL